jgi:D-alanyl-D-alanine carboxypeptidase (penicillin-binding protein 5/6)
MESPPRQSFPRPNVPSKVPADGSVTPPPPPPPPRSGPVLPPRPPLRIPGGYRFRPRHERLRVTIAVFVTLILIIVLAELAASRLYAPAPQATIKATIPRTIVISGRPPAIPWPTKLQAALAIPKLGVFTQSGPEHSVPVASLTKIMTAYIILKDHPLTTTSQGPSVTMTPTDVSYFNTDTVTDQANVQVVAGETLSERQLLEGLLIHSANNLAETLARWDAGSVAAFVAKMNATAASLGMHQTNYVDPNGFNPASESTPADELRVASKAMAIPAFTQMVSMQSVTLPVAGTVSTYTPLLNVTGVVGVKSGYTSMAGGCDVIAYEVSVQQRLVVVLAAVTGVTGPNVLTLAGLDALNLARVGATGVNVVPMTVKGATVATANVAGHSVPVRTTGTADLMVWSTQRVAQRIVVSHAIKAGDKSGTPVGSVEYLVGSQRVTVPIALGGALPSLSLFQRLF